MSEQSTVKGFNTSASEKVAMDLASAKALEAKISVRQKDLIFVLFGAGGNLASLKLFLALFQSFKEEKLPANFTILAVDLNPEMTSGSFRGWVRQDLLDKGPESEEMAAFLEHIVYFPFNVLTGNYQSLKDKISGLETERKVSPNRKIIYFLSLLPNLFEPTIQGLGQAGLLADENARLAVEKPFGSSLESAQKLNAIILQYCQESQIYRMDHWLGKETVQNLLNFRFANGIFEHLWSRQFIDYIEITAAETVLVPDGRGYVGALKDMVVNHLFQLICLLLMEPPNSLSADDIRDEKVKLLRVLKADPKFTIRGYYEGYDRTEETYIALKLMVDNYRWQGIPIYVRPWKGAKNKETEISAHFKGVPSTLFTAIPNTLVLRLQPDEAISLTWNVKVPGEPNNRQKSLDFLYNSKGGFEETIPEAYQTLIESMIEGDRTLFVRADEVEAQWAVVMPILNHWETLTINNGHLSESDIVHTYPVGSDGPTAANQILEPNHKWRSL
ncbi:Glucose-6-phosphate 1-dehydrogenase [Planktothrix tepida]|uniref:Glucose-6-phosphate 1-dehydrogenase n=2 Tax=Planktothrix TaxID=54304 RepID=A0A1J1LSR2_9CYAN|nr:glucose-6-phosphate dehydrogenase [Planktothrix tepida]CAD5990246.1 Glucose-6-phosphate 1-dehydrogenase [Planktothrix tepida]CUR35643.1 Glucose-6-phosphate 1-dehydrogenase [Planktothrix tepida PCC 9214]